MCDGDRWRFCFHCKRAILAASDAMRGVSDVGGALVHVACYEAHVQWSSDFDAEWDRAMRAENRMIGRVALYVLGSLALLGVIIWTVAR